MSVNLTPEMRTWLGRQHTDVLLYDLMLSFIVKFNVTPVVAGKLLAQWVRETV